MALTAHNVVVGRLGTQCERVRRIPTPGVNGSTRSPLAQKMIRGAAVQAASSTSQDLAKKNHRAKRPMTKARIEEVNADDDKCRAHDDVLADGTPAVLKRTQEPINPDEAVVFGAAVQAASSSNAGCGKKIIVPNAVSKTRCERAKPTLSFVPLALPKARPKEVTMDHFRNSGTQRCRCDSSIDTRIVHDVICIRGPAPRLIAQNLTHHLFHGKEFNLVEAVALGATVHGATSTGGIDKLNAHDFVVGPIQLSCLTLHTWTVVEWVDGWNLRTLEDHRSTFRANERRGPVRSKVLRKFLAAHGTFGSDQQQRRRTQHCDAQEKRLQRKRISSRIHRTVRPKNPQTTEKLKLQSRRSKASHDSKC